MSDDDLYALYVPCSTLGLDASRTNMHPSRERNDMTKTRIIRYRVNVRYDGAIAVVSNCLDVKATDIESALRTVREKHGGLPGFRVVQIYET